MFDPTAFDQLISGRRRGWWAATQRGLLRVAETPYRWAVEYRNRRFDHGRRSIGRVDVPVISVGNITAGGTGKTPLVAWLARWYRRAGVRVALISRGYKAQKGQANDEARELQRLLPDVPHLQNPDRVAAARQAVEQLDCELIILDDAFQHRRIHRNLDIVLIDALKPFGYEHLLPRGLLREPLAGLARADVIGLSRVDAVSESTRAGLREQIARWAPDADRVDLAHQPRLLVNQEGVQRPAETLAGKRVAAFCGIGNPDGFRATLEQIGCQLVAFEIFPDHYAYRTDDIETVYQKYVSSENRVDAIVCTSKDLVKISVDASRAVPLWALTIEIEVTDGLHALETRLHELLDRVKQRR